MVNRNYASESYGAGEYCSRRCYAHAKPIDASRTREEYERFPGACNNYLFWQSEKHSRTAFFLFSSLPPPLYPFFSFAVCANAVKSNEREKRREVKSTRKGGRLFFHYQRLSFSRPPVRLRGHFNPRPTRGGGQLRHSYSPSSAFFFLFRVRRRTAAAASRSRSWLSKKFVDTSVL